MLDRRVVGVWLALGSSLACAKAPPSRTPDRTPLSADVIQARLESKTVLAGFRASRYALEPFPSPTYWESMAKTMASHYPSSTPGGVWIVGTLHERGCKLNFPAPNNREYDEIRFADEDLDEAALTHFDASGLKVWVQVEPGYTHVPDLIELVMERYGHHPSVIGFGVDVEWNQSTSPDAGVAVSDEQAADWLARVRQYDPTYTLMLKHWLPEKMPPTLRDGLFFLDDSQMFARKRELVDEFIVWGETFEPAPVGFQIGYPNDRKWWGELDDPARDLGRELAAVIPNATGIFWVDFTVAELFPLR